MEESQNNLMWMKRKQILKSHIQAPFGAYNNNNSWEERAFAEDAARILGGCIWPPRSYSCNFCKREFRSAQALGGHMNVHRRDRARLKQNLSHQALHCPHKNDLTTSRPTSWSSTISTKENCFHQATMSPYSSSISWGSHMECPDYSEPKGIVNGREQFFKGLGYNDYVETSLSVGQNSVFSQKLPTDDYSCGDDGITYKKKPKTCSISSLSPHVFLKPCSNDKLVTFQSAEFLLGLKPVMEDLDLELRLGKTQKV